MNMEVVDRLDYDQVQPKNSSFPYLVFLHGAGGDKRQWESQIDFFSKNGYGVLAISLQNHGESHSDHNLKLNQESESQELIKIYTNDIAVLISSLKIKNYCLAGHSMGGAIVLSLVISINNGVFQDPPPLPKLIFLIGTGAKLNVAAVFFDLLKDDFSEALKLMGKFSYGDNADLAIKQKNQDILTKNGYEVLYNDLDACRYFDVRQSLTLVNIPTVIICGARDQMTPPKFSLYLHENIRTSRIFIIPDVGHFVFQEAPEQVNEIIYISLQ